MKAWHCFLQKLEEDFGKETVDRWLRTLKVIRFDAANLHLEASDSFQALWFNEHIAKRAKLELNVNGRPVRIHLATKGGVPKKVRKTKAIEKPKEYTYDPDPIDKKFSEWISHEESRLAEKVLCNLESFNPTYLFGPKGSGKTHLLMAAAKRLQDSGVNAYFVRAETFTAHVVRAIRCGDMDTFRKAYRKIEALFLDDIEVLSGKAATQEEFFHTFNTLHSAGIPIVLSATKSPRGLKDIEDRLVSRFEWGISLPITPLPDRTHFLEDKIKKLPLKIHPSCITFLLDTFATVGGVSEAIETIKYHGQIHNKSTYDLVDLKTILRHLVEQEERAKLSAEKIIDQVAAHFEKKSEEITGRGQTKEIAFPRQIAMYFLRKKLALSYTKIGSLMSRDHSTVMTSVKHIEESLEKGDADISSIVGSLHQILR